MMKNSDLMISVSGVRGIVGQSLTPELLVRLGHAFGTYLRSGKVIVGRDTRASGEMARLAVLSGLIASGCRVLDIGICATPTATLMIEHHNAAGGVMVTASHNPIEWNALKFFRADGIYLNADESRDLLNLYYSGQFAHARWDELQPVETLRHSDARHVERVLSILDRGLIRSKKFKIALDCVNGAGCGIGERLLRELGCRVEMIHCTPDGRFPHKPEPVTDNLRSLCDFVRSVGADAGFATDPDADRVALVDQRGVALGEEAGLALCAQHVLSSATSKAPVVINLSTSRMTEEVALQAGHEVVRTPAGEVNVAEKMKELNAVFGGEGNGGIIAPRVHCGRDSIVGIGLALEYMARSGKTMRQLAASLPPYFMVKTKLDLPPGKSREIIHRLSADASDARIDTRDGLRLEWDDCWVQLRASNTEPIMRILAEARTPQAAQSLVDAFKARIEALQNLSAEKHRSKRRNKSSLLCRAI
jgi:phosphomannomutase